jgi:hypothetical protein
MVLRTLDGPCFFFQFLNVDFECEELLGNNVFLIVDLEEMKSVDIISGTVVRVIVRWLCFMVIWTLDVGTWVLVFGLSCYRDLIGFLSFNSQLQ